MTKIVIYYKNPSYADSDELSIHYVTNDVEDVVTYLDRKGYEFVDSYWYENDDGDETWISCYKYKQIEFSNLEDLV